MATVIRGDYREQAAHFGLYRTSVGGDEGIIVRRKCGEPTDYQHSKSRKLKICRDNLALASQDYAKLSPSQKAIGRHQFEEVEYQISHGKTDTKLLMGRQLFISKEIHSLNTTGKQQLLPHELCIMLTDQNNLPLSGELWLRFLKDEAWHEITKEELATGSWLFSQVPVAQEAYRPYGEAIAFIDPLLEETQFMSESQLRLYHYHKLIPLEPHYDWTDYGTGSIFYRYRKAPIPISHLYFSWEVLTQDFTGFLLFAIYTHGWPFKFEFLLRYEIVPVIFGEPQWQYFNSTFGNVNIAEDDYYWMVFQRSEEYPDLGTLRMKYFPYPCSLHVNYWEIP